jgi:hypothetical protein
MNLEERLRAALRREEPSAGFAERVVARAESGSRVRLQPRPAFRLVWAAAAMAAAVAVVMSSMDWYQRRQQERAARQAALALQIVAEKLDLARSKVLKRAEAKAGPTEN